MSFTRRVTLLVACAVTVAVGLASVLAYVAHRAELRRGVDRSLNDRATVLRRFAARGFPDPTAPPPPATRPGEVETYVTVLRADGTLHTRSGGVALPELPAARAVARAGAGRASFDTHVRGVHVRELIVPLGRGGALEVGRSLAEVDGVLRHLRWILVATILGGVALAVALGRLVAQRALAPVRRLSEASDYVARTRDLGRRLDVHPGGDELDHLAANFNEMLDALEGSMRAQRQLVADASHELRTLVTSIRTNVEVLRERGEALDPARRAEVLERVLSQVTELAALMNDLIELARGDHVPAAREALRFDELVAEAIARAERHAPASRFAAQLEPTVVEGERPRLARAVNNLLTNAVHHNGDAHPIDVTLSDGALTVRDHGPGIRPTEREQVFDRFYRGADARAHPGSGLGLAIVRQVAETHGGMVTVTEPPGGGSAFVLRLPRAAAAAPAAEAAGAAIFQ
jgi:two-component system sensor histidine kinase MprB